MKNKINEKVLIIDDEKNMLHMLCALLKKSGYRVDTALNGEEGLQKVLDAKNNNDQYDFILCDLKMPVMDGMAFLSSAKELLTRTPVIMMSAYGSLDTAVEAMKQGAYNYISKPFKMDEVLLTLKKAMERETLKKENLFLKKQIQQIKGKYKVEGMIAQAKAMQPVIRLIEKASQYNTTVLILGETGTGKELIANSIHFNGTRSKFPFVPVNCGGIPENLLESEFFGHKKGAFTGADSHKKGFFEEADKGTIFLDEIGELSLQLQVKLLRVFQENEIRRVGDSKTKKIDIRIIAATSKNLSAEVDKGTFRKDLYYRLNVLPINLPPLRERAEDIPLLTRHFVDKFNKKFKMDIKDLSSGAVTMLLQHGWPGNIRELENAIERGVILAEKGILLPENLPPELGAQQGNARMDDVFGGFSIKKARQIMEKRLISRALEATRGNRTKTAKLLEISHPSLLSKIKTYGIEE
ncbi:MAG TPA: hypothetical protein DD405_01005 [Desulfobacteraceae bacterium]|nr:hypothetical protein [Desulfobacteraceae bacterium]